MGYVEPRGSSHRAVVRGADGKRHTKTFDSRREALQWVKAEEDRRATLTGPGHDILVEAMIEAYQTHIGAHTDSARGNKYRIKSWHRAQDGRPRDPLLTMRIGDVTTHDINEWIQRRLKTIRYRTKTLITPATVDRDINLLSAMWTWAIKVRKWVKENPCHGAMRPPVTPGRQRPLLTPDELTRIETASGLRFSTELKTHGAKTGACFFLGLETGMRSGEILRLKPQDYLKDQRVAIVSATEKGGRKGARSGRARTDASRRVPLTERAVELLDALLAANPGGRYIVGIDDEQRQYAWRKIRHNADVDNLKFHDSKHEAATRLSKFLDVIALSHAIGTKDIRLLRDTYYINDASEQAKLLPARLSIATRGG